MWEKICDSWKICNRSLVGRYFCHQWSSSLVKLTSPLNILFFQITSLLSPRKRLGWTCDGGMIWKTEILARKNKRNRFSQVVNGNGCIQSSFYRWRWSSNVDGSHQCCKRPCRMYIQSTVLRRMYQQTIQSYPKGMLGDHVVNIVKAAGD